VDRKLLKGEAGPQRGLCPKGTDQEKNENREMRSLWVKGEGVPPVSPARDNVNAMGPHVDFVQERGNSGVKKVKVQPGARLKWK